MTPESFKIKTSMNLILEINSLMNEIRSLEKSINYKFYNILDKIYTETDKHVLLSLANTESVECLLVQDRYGYSIQYGRNLERLKVNLIESIEFGLYDVPEIVYLETPGVFILKETGNF